MKRLPFAVALLSVIAASPANAASVVDAVGDVLPSFVGTGSPDLDVTNFAVSMRSATSFRASSVPAVRTST